MRIAASGWTAARFCSSGSPTRTSPSASASAGASPRNAAATTCAPASKERTCWASEVAGSASVIRTAASSSGRAGEEAVANVLLLEIAADEHHLRLPPLVRPPFALRVAVEHHVDTLEHEALGVVLHRHDPLAAQDVGPLFLGDAVDPGHELGGIDVALESQRDRLHVLVVIVLQPVMMMGVVMIMVVVVLFGSEKVGLDVENAVEIE